MSYYRRSSYAFRGARFAANVDRSMPLVTGNTFPVKDAIKALSSLVRWDGEHKGWRVPAEVYDAAVAIVNGAGPKRSAAPRRSYSNSYQDHDYEGSGKQYYVNPRGQCEDAPCCGCCGYM